MIDQIIYTTLFYLGVILLFRLAGKRLAGQITTFDLMVLIALIVTLQGAFLLDGRENKFVFVITGFILHLGTSALCRKYAWLRHLLRGKPTHLVQEGELVYANIRQEGLTLEELHAGLRKAGIEDVGQVKVAFLEETGQISAIKRDL